jgi:uncharacterized protein DUF6431/helix-turn-helix protein
VRLTPTRENEAGPASLNKITGARVLTSSVLIVGVLPGEVESMLAAGVGPGLACGARCPDCGGPLVGSWRGYRRLARVEGRVVVLQIARSRCATCRRTHALIPSFLVPGRLDGVASVIAALQRGARGVGQRRIAAQLGLPETTVRGWCQRLRAGAGALVGRLVALADALGAGPGRAPPVRDGLAGLVDVLGALHRAAGRRLGAAGLLDPAGLLVAVTGRALLAHTISPLPGGGGGREGSSRPPPRPGLSPGCGRRPRGRTASLDQ